MTPLRRNKTKSFKNFAYGVGMKPIAVICNRCGSVLGMAGDVAEASEKNRVHAAECEVLNGWA